VTAHLRRARRFLTLQIVAAVVLLAAAAVMLWPR